MKRLFSLALGALVLAGMGWLGLRFFPIGESAPPTIAQLSGDPGKGAYLARMSGCIACHTDTKNGGAPLAGGVTLPTDFGTFYSPNITTDKDNGIGSWTVEEFAVAVRQGISPQGQPYYAAFPYPFYAKFSDQDIADLWAAFQTVPPVEEASRSHGMKFPFNLRDGLKVWRAAFLDFKPFVPDPQKDQAWNRGKYIVKGPAHCGACHTPRNFAGARQAEQFLHGGEDLPGGGSAPPITTAALTETGWNEQDLVHALRTGILPDGDVFGGAMAEVVREGTAFLTDQDLQAIATFLMDQER